MDITGLLSLVATNDVASVTRLVEQQQVNVNLRDAEDGRGALHLAADAHLVSMMDRLLELKADPNAKDARGLSPLQGKRKINIEENRRC